MLFEAKGNSKKIRRTLKEIIGKNCSKTKTADFLSVNGNIITDNCDIVNEFNNYFSNVADEVMGQLPKLSNIYQPSGEFSKFLKDKLAAKNKFSIPQITIDTVYNLEE